MADKRAKAPAKGASKKAVGSKKGVQRPSAKASGSASARKRPAPVAKKKPAKSAAPAPKKPAARKATARKAAATRSPRPARTPSRPAPEKLRVAPPPEKLRVAPAGPPGPAPAPELRPPEPVRVYSGPRAHPDAGLSQSQVELLHRRLLEERDRVLTGIRRHVSDATQHNDELAEDGDMASRDSQQSYLLRLADKERKLILEIEEAIQRLHDGDYGICEGTEEPIGFPRLQVRPWTRYSVAYKELLERQGGD